MKRLLLAAALAVSATAGPAAVASPGVQGCAGEHCVDVSPCDVAAEGCLRPPQPWPPVYGDCAWVHAGGNLWYVICW